MRLANEEFDVLVIGGGVTGAGAALDAASRGLKVALVESQDFASGTSSRSSKLIHGGLRYLEQYDFKLVREALHERELMVSTLSPHLVKPVAFLFPLNQGYKERTYIGAGLALYDALRGFQRTLPWHKHLGSKTIAEIAPSLRSDLVKGAIKYFDAQVDDARHTLSLVRTAAKHGAVIAQRVKVTSAIWENSKIVGVNALDSLTGNNLKIQAKSTILCAGIWSDAVHKDFGITAGYNVAMSKGVHITVPKSAVNSRAGVILKTEVSVLFIIPWEDKWIIGTTDTPYTGDRENPVASKEDIRYILNQANRVLQPKISESQILGVYAGLRPLVASKSHSSTTKLSREHIVDNPVPGFVSIAGGKYTTYRIMAKDVIDLAATSIRRKIPESVTEKLPILGADGYFALSNQLESISQVFNVDLETIKHLFTRHGANIFDVLNIVQKDGALAERITPELLYIRAEVVYAVQSEGALTLEDVLARRTRISIESADSGLAIAEQVARIMATILGWSEEECKRALLEYVAYVDSERKELDSNLESLRP